MMVNLRVGGDNDYVEANRPELQRRYNDRVAEIRSRYAKLQTASMVTRCFRRLALRWEIVRAKRDFGKGNLYWLESAHQFVAD